MQFHLGLDFVLSTAMVSVFTFATVKLLLGWLADLRFYQSNRWKFTEERSGRIKVTSSQTGNGKEVTAYKRVFFGLPFLILGMGAVAIISSIKVIQLLLGEQ